MERSRMLSGARAAEALFLPICGAHLTIQAVITTIVRDGDVMRLGNGLQL